MKKVETKELLKIQIGIHNQLPDILKVIKDAKDLIFDVFENNIIITEYTERDETKEEIKARENAAKQKEIDKEINEKNLLKTLKQKYEKDTDN